MATRSNQVKGIIFLVVAAFGFALMSLLVKLVGENGSPLPSAQMVLFRNAISMVISLVLVIKSKAFISSSENIKWLLLRSTFGTLGMVLFFYSIANVESISDANMLNKLSTFFLILFSAVFLRERVKIYQVIGIVIAFAGSVLIIKPEFTAEMLPYITSVLAAIFAGAAYTVLRVLGNKEEYYTVVLFFSTFSVLVLLPYVLIFNHAPMNITQIFLLIGAGAAATIGQFGTTLAYKFAPAREISIFNYTNVIFAAMFGLMFLGEVPDLLSIIGYVIIFGAAYLVFKLNKA